METIKITVTGQEFEQVTLELSAEEVSLMYKQRKEQQERIAELEKKAKDSESNCKYATDRRDAAESELSHANVLLTALGVQEKTSEEEAYYRKVLPVATRIALYIAASATK
jgi:multidrug resistance efflux pump